MDILILDRDELNFEPMLLRRESNDLPEQPELRRENFEEEVVNKDQNNLDLDDFFGGLYNIEDALKEAEDELDFLRSFNLDDNSYILSEIELLHRLRQTENQNHLMFLSFLRCFNQETESSIPTYEELMENIYKRERFLTFEEMPLKDTYDFDKFHIKCKICYKLSSNYHEITCKHTYCNDCFIQFCNFLLESFNFFPEDLKCPECQVLFEEKLFIRYLKYEDSSRLASLREKVKNTRLVNDGKAKPCPMPDCPGIGHILIAEETTACNKCRTTLCISCGLCYHPGITCEESLKSNDHDFELFITNSKMKKCPTCGVLVEKLDGCQFLYCSSPTCKRQSFLCNLCGKKLTEALHHNHFKTKGPYGDSCNTLDGIQDP
jgi:hypothetical protein